VHKKWTAQKTNSLQGNIDAQIKQMK